MLVTPLSPSQPEHVLSALKELGFGDFIGEVQQAWELAKEEAKSKYIVPV